jgi:hypothetical protein
MPVLISLLLLYEWTQQKSSILFFQMYRLGILFVFFLEIC